MRFLMLTRLSSMLGSQHNFWRVQVKGLSNTFAEPEGSPLSWRTDMRYSGLNIGMMGIFYEPLQR
jgi:hypothetical protein